MYQLSSLFGDPPLCIDLDVGADGHLSGLHAGSVSDQQSQLKLIAATVGCIVDDRQTPRATRTCLTNRPRDAKLTLDFEVILQFRSRLISLFL